MRRVLAAMIVFFACGEDRVFPAPTDPTAGIDTDCDPIVPERCGFPFPNDYWSKNGHVAFGKNTLPLARGKQIDPAAWADADGFSVGQAPMTFLPNASATGLPTHDDMAASTAPDSATVLLEADTGDRVAHFSEIDMSTFHDDDRALLLRPAIRLKDKARYIVAVRHVVDADGNAIAPSASFKALRDGTMTTSAALEARRAHFEDIFSRLEIAGVARKDLQIAWDYTTASRDNQTRVMLAMRDDALAKVGAMGPEYTITNVELDPNPWVTKRLTGMMTVPLYLDKPESGGRLVLGADGLPKQNGTAQYEFLVHIPKSATPQTQAYLLQNGHGLLGSKSEGEDSYLAEICGKYNYVAIAVDWIGMAHEDVDLVTDAVSTGDVSKFRAAVDRQHQGFINALLAMRMLSGRMATDPNLSVNGQTIVDTAHRFYRGDSQGGIFGATYMSISTDVTRGLLGEPGMPYNILLDRSVDFGGLKFLLKGAIPNGLDVQLALGLVQMIWDRTEPNGYAAYMTDNLLPNTPKHEVLMHVAIGDHQVTTLGAHVLARTIGAKNLAPVNRSIFGIPEANAPLTGNVMVEFDFGLHEEPRNLPTQDGEDPHDKVRFLDAAMKQSDAWFRTGVVSPTCDGPCNPE
jgi:hypothetical protein